MCTKLHACACSVHISDILYFVYIQACMQTDQMEIDSQLHYPIHQTLQYEMSKSACMYYTMYSTIARHDMRHAYVVCSSDATYVISMSLRHN